MKQKRSMVVVAAVILQTTVLFAPAQGWETNDNGFADLPGDKAKSMESFQLDKAVQRAFRAGLDRKTSGPELRWDRRQIEVTQWTDDESRDEYRNRSESRRYSREAPRDLDWIIRQAYDDILRREPDEESLRYYRSRMTDFGWTERDVRDDLQRSGEVGRQGSQISRQEAEQIVRRAYRDVLGREPDPGAQGWVDKILRDRWTERDVVEALRDSDEYRRGGQISRQQAEQIVRRAYREVLRREPDPGAQGWVDKILRDRWTEQDVVRALRDSDEYRNRRR